MDLNSSSLLPRPGCCQESCHREGEVSGMEVGRDRHRNLMFVVLSLF